MSNNEQPNMNELYEQAVIGSKQVIVKITKNFYENFNKKDRFSLTVKSVIPNSMPPKYNEKLINRINRLVAIGRSNNYHMKFYKWKITKEYC